MTTDREYNVAVDFVDRNVQEGRGAKTAFVDPSRNMTYGELLDQAARVGPMLARFGVEQENRIALILLDTVEFPVLFWGAVRAGVVPVLLNTRLTVDQYHYLLADSRAKLAFVSTALLPVVQEAAVGVDTLKAIVVVGGGPDSVPRMDSLLAAVNEPAAPAKTCGDEVAYWLYSSGTTGNPKGVMHVHSSPMVMARTAGQDRIGIREDDVVFSAAKLFFAYGLGNGLSFPLSVGATTVLMAERPTPQAVFARLRKHQPTIFYGVPTLFAALLASPELPQRGELKMRVCTSAGEALPADIGRRWTERFGVEILDGLGSTEMLHIFLSNRPGRVRYGTSGTPVPGYELRILGDDGRPAPPGEVGELQINGPTAAMGYWNNRAKSRDTFQGPWTRSGDKYAIDAEGHYVYSGRSDDMLKVGGIYVSPIEVEAALITHPAVLEAAVIGREDDERLVKPSAYVVLRPGQKGSDALADELRAHVKSQLAPYKYPRWIEFIDELPKTATGKIQRFKLRAQAA
jgi:benzoate-CoA ligase